LKIVSILSAHLSDALNLFSSSSNLSLAKDATLGQKFQWPLKFLEKVFLGKRSGIAEARGPK